LNQMSSAIEPDNGADDYKSWQGDKQAEKLM
jgi:hypothetical protein